MHLAVEQVIFFAGHFVDPIHVDRVQGMGFIHRQALRAAIDLPRAREDDLDLRVADATRFQDGELRVAIDLQIGQRIRHRIEVACLASEVEEIILSLHQIAHAVGIAHVRDVDLQAVAEWLDVKKIPAIIRDEAVEHRDLRAEMEQLLREIRSDKSKPAGDQNFAALEMAFHVDTTVTG